MVIDPHVARTKDRPLATGAIDPREAVMLSIALGLVALGLAFTLNPLTWLLALGGAFLLLTYPLMTAVQNNAFTGLILR